MADGAAGEESTKAKVLVVDDVEDNRDLLVRRLGRKGYDASAVPDGPSALDAIETGEYDVILLDVMMPGMSGVEVLERIREDHTKTALPVIMATAKSDSQDVVLALSKGANDYVTKPIDFPILLARLESHLATRRDMLSAAQSQPRAAAIDADGGVLAPGTKIDERYEILEPLGSGGFAVVYKAKQLSTDRVVAFKCLRPERTKLQTSQTELKRFEREMKVIGQLEHPNIVRLIDSGTIPVKASGEWVEGPGIDGSGSDPSLARTVAHKSGQSGTRPSKVGEGEAEELKVPYIVMEYVEGRSLAELIEAEGRLPAQRAVDLLLPVLGALAVAHDEGIVHRDVKPHNVLLQEGKKEGELEPKVLDFGIAKLADPRAQQLTVTDGFLGTPEYMSPEQAQGAKDLDERADQFSLGAMLYETLTGVRPYRSDSLISLVRAVAMADFPSPRELCDDIDERLEAVLLKAMSRDREQRYASVEMFGRALLSFGSGQARLKWEAQFGAVDEPEEQAFEAPSPAVRGSADTLDPEAEPLAGVDPDETPDDADGVDDDAGDRGPRSDDEDDEDARVDLEDGDDERDDGPRSTALETPHAKASDAPAPSPAADESRWILTVAVVLGVAIVIALIAMLE